MIEFDNQISSKEDRNIKNGMNKNLSKIEIPDDDSDLPKYPKIISRTKFVNVFA